MKISAKSLFAILCAVMLSFSGMVYANTPDGETHEVETFCSDLHGKPFRICRDYCEKLNCGSNNHHDRPKACHRLLKQWNRTADGQPLPCESEPGISLVKNINGVNADPEDNPIDVGTAITYTFDIVNSGNVALQGITISDPTLAGEGITITCTPSQAIDLEIGASASCISTQSTAQEGAHTNTATVSGGSIYGEPVSAVSTTGYFGVPVQPTLCPCADRWGNGEFVPGAPALPQDLSNGQLTSTSTSTGCFIANGPSSEDNVQYILIKFNNGTNQCRDSLGSTLDPGPIVPSFTPEEDQACFDLLEAEGCVPL